MRDEMDLDARLSRLTRDLVLSPEDERALTQLQTGPEGPAAVRASLRRRRRHALRALAVAVAAIAALGAAAVAVASGPASVILAFHSIGWGANAGPVRGGASPCIPERRTVPLAELRRLVPFPVLTASAPGAVLTSSTYSPPCGPEGALVELVYDYRGGSFVLDERAAPKGPLQVNLKDYAKSSWRVVTIDGRDYGVQVLPVRGQPDVSTVAVAEFKQGGTQVDFTAGAKGSGFRPISLAEFEELARTIG